MDLKTEDEVREKVLTLVEYYKGLKPLDLIGKLTEEERALFSGQLLEQMVQDGDLMELEFTLPHDPDMVHSFLVPIGTGLNVRYAVTQEKDSIPTTVLH